MVGDPGRPAPARRVRRLNEPRPAKVRPAPNGEPAAVFHQGDWRPVHLTRSPWEIEQHWWRGREIRRVYYQVALHEGPTLIVFRDASTEEWFRQEY